MNVLRMGFVALLCCSTTALAAPAQESTIRELLAVTRAEKVVDSLAAQYQAVLNASLQQTLHGRTPTPKQQAAITHYQAAMAGILKEALAWEKFEPMYVRLYQQTFTEEELAGMLAFYRTPAGQSLITKMPTLLQNVMKETPALMADTVPKLRKAQQDFAAELKAANE